MPNPRQNKRGSTSRHTARKTLAAGLTASLLAALPAASADAGNVELVVDLGNGGALSLRSDTGSALDIHGYSIFSTGGFLADTGDETLGGLLLTLINDTDNVGSDEVATVALGGGVPTAVSLPASPASLALNLAWNGGLGGDPIADLFVEYGPADPGQPVTVALDPLDIIVLLGGITGDYNASGQVEQGDLDLVLQNWGVDTDTAGIPAGWINDLPMGQIEQTELDGVLSNWGATSAPNFTGSSVPEPASLLAFSAFLGLGAGLRRRPAKKL